MIREFDTPFVRTRVLLVSVSLVALLLALPLLGCSEPRSDVPATPPPPAPVSLEAMPLESRHAQLPEGFPLELPMPAGKVVRADHQGPAGSEAWQYEMLLDVPVAMAADWYVQAYQGRSWQLFDRRVSGTGKDEALTLVLGKGTAESLVSLAAGGEGRTRARGSLGLGVSVTDTY